MVKNYDTFQQNDVTDNVESCDGDDVRSNNSKDKRPRRRSYASNVQGRLIVNAVTGVPYPWRVGSIYEDLLWKVCDSNARYGKLEPDMYFYDSPKQAIEHRRYRQDVFSADTLNWWKAKVARITRLMEEEDNE